MTRLVHLNRALVSALLIVSLSPSTGLAEGLNPPSPAQTKMRSPAMAITGGAISGVGLAMAITHGDTYCIFGYQYCVTPTTIDYGRCEEPAKAQQALGLYFIAAGAAMVVFGLSRVEVSPMVSPTVKGARATVTW